ncbi:MAG TPA: hypothetical protein PLU52_08980 [Opitutaceae bacterium]|nr:hypothetical protein [Opitutaceae bacterium]HND62744.1 hypothetical protein [Opitutaceae bacterium]
MNPRRIRLAGILILAAGLIAAVVIYALAEPEEDRLLLGVNVRTNRDTLDLQKMGGKSYVVFHDFSQWFAARWQGEQLAYTVAFLAFATFVVSRWLANFLSLPGPDAR